MSKKQGFIEYKNYRQAYYILLEYWDSFHDEDKKEIDKRLKKLDL
jgi:hypothetical protein